MESPVAPFRHRRSHLMSRSYRSLIHLCSSFDREPRVSLATPDVLQKLVSSSDIAQVSLGEAREPGEVCKPPETSPMVESKSDGFEAETLETILQETSLMLGDFFDGIDLQDATSAVGSRQRDLFDEFEVLINESGDFAPDSCVNLFEGLDDGGGVDLVQNDAEKPVTSTELQLDTIQGVEKVSESVLCKVEVPISVESNEVISSGALETSNGTIQREMELEKPVNSTEVLPGIVEGGDDVEEGEISGDENDDMLVGDDDLPAERHEESNFTQELVDKRGEGAGYIHHACNRSFGSSSSKAEIVDEKVQRQEHGVLASNVDNREKKSEDKMDPGTGIKKRSAPSKEAKARKKANSRKRRAEKRIALGVKKLKLKTVAPIPKPIQPCRHYVKGRCYEGEKCKFSHDVMPETKSVPCCYFATQSCMKGDACPYDHDLSKYPCKNFITSGFCHRGDKCLFSHKGTPHSASDTLNSNVTAPPTNMAEASFSSQSSKKQTVREAIARLPSIQASSAAFLKLSSQSNQRNSSAASSSPKMNELVVTTPLRKPSVAPKGMSFLSLDKIPQAEDTLKPSPASKQNTQNSENQSLKQLQQRSILPHVLPKGIGFLNQEPREPESSRNLTTRPDSHIQRSLNSAMKLAAEFETAKVERGAKDLTVVSKGDVTVTTVETKNSGNMSSKILEFLSSFSNDNMKI